MSTTDFYYMKLLNFPDQKNNIYIDFDNAHLKITESFLIKTIKEQKNNHSYCNKKHTIENVIKFNP